MSTIFFSSYFNACNPHSFETTRVSRRCYNTTSNVQCVVEEFWSLLAICSLVCKKKVKWDLAIVSVLLFALAIGNLKALLIIVLRNTLFLIKTLTKTYCQNLQCATLEECTWNASTITLGGVSRKFIIIMGPFQIYF